MSAYGPIRSRPECGFRASRAIMHLVGLGATFFLVNMFILNANPMNPREALDPKVSGPAFSYYMRSGTLRI